MKTTNLIMIIVIISLVILGFVGLNKKQTENAINQNVFEGVITNMNIEPSVLDGTGVYDKTCKMIENGLSQCDAGIQTEKGLLNFNYKHNMNLQGCIDSGQKLKVEILADNKARVTRL
mgnify:FL=1